ncbi:hypothetical protein [Reinekea sp.]
MCHVRPEIPSLVLKQALVSTLVEDASVQASLQPIAMEYYQLGRGLA